MRLFAPAAPRRRRSSSPLLSLSLSLWSLLLLTIQTSALDLNLDDADSIKQAASTVAHGLVSYYHGNETGQIPGLLPGPYYWWEAGAMFMTLVEYWYYTGDTTYNDITTQALLFQTGPDADYMPANQTKSEGNDDQVFWAFACLSAAELGFPNPPASSPQWLALAQAVFNTQVTRWDAGTCGGGLRWQIFTFNNGYDYKNTISNGGFFQLAARLARYTGNATYGEWAEKMWDWMADSPLMMAANGAATTGAGGTPATLNIYDGTSTSGNCSEADHLQWTYNYGTLIAGSAYMYNFSNSTDQQALWSARLSALLSGADVFFPSDFGSQIMSEVSCEPGQTCNNDQPSFKAYLSRWMAVAAQLAPSTAAAISPRLRASAAGAAKQCSGGASICGRRWYQDTYDGTAGVGEQMSALSVIGSQMLHLDAAGAWSAPRPPLTAYTGGNSTGNASAGTGDGGATGLGLGSHEITTGDKAAAWILTLFVACGMVGIGFFMLK
ncbi:glycosyl hydrolase family 76-domain-containing protein [Phyllosticta capitalensis]|uniref:glycosyl hydrolase family 76-domain-containing protein n=1 Tax=Phyllosticta capitalensis TaxID=121624 RepID=UPI00313091CB